MNVQQLKKYIIEPTLEMLGMKSDSAVNLLLGTAAVESKMGYYIHQVKGIACGIYQIEPATDYDVHNNYLMHRHELARVVESLTTKFPEQSQKNNLIGNLFYQTAIARIIYYRAPEKLPSPDDIEGLAWYWKKHYNSYLGKGTVPKFVDAYKTYVEGNNL